MSGVTPIQARDFYRAAASFYRQSPWRSVGSHEPIKVECAQLEGGPQFAIVLGKKGKIKGLWLCDDWKTCVLVEQGQYKTVAEPLSLTALHFGDRSEISPDDLEKAQRHGFEVASPGAYPVVFRKEPGKDFRSPDAGELDLLEACLWVIPDSIERTGSRSTEIFEYNFRGVIGPMTLDLSWVPVERPNGLYPEGAA